MKHKKLKIKGCMGIVSTKIEKTYSLAIKHTTRLGYNEFDRLIVDGRKQPEFFSYYPDSDKDRCSMLYQWAERIKQVSWLGSQLLSNKQTRQKVVDEVWPIIDVLTETEFIMELDNNGRLTFVHTDGAHALSLNHRATMFDGWIFDNKEIVSKSIYISKVLDSLRYSMCLHMPDNVYFRSEDNRHPNLIAYKMMELKS